MNIVEKYKQIIDAFDKKQRKYMHYCSVANFIDHLDQISSPDVRELCEIRLAEYLEEVMIQSEDLKTGKCSSTLYVDYLHPMEQVFINLGFKRVIPMHVASTIGIIVDLGMYMLFFKFPYPILSFLTYAYFWLFESKYYKAGKVYGMLY